ncbi:ABC transporter substrate-binding protein [Agromyces laixinhei]|uniref:ABC transporter substrate-binding protein n=1 Tax=Agromyces laixinhei TaxID=2585717 RepID=UPI0018DE8E7A|nr:ABC transporter substrate-binding protein [Agromyces laixinhei]
MAAPYATETLDPHSVASAANGNTHAAMAIYSRLVKTTNDGEIVPDLAESWEANENGTEWTFQLRDDVVFSDGTPLVAADVVASFERLVSVESPLSANFKGVTASNAGDTTVVLTSETPLILGRVALLFVTKAGVTEDDFQAPIGSGPYVVEDFTPADTLTLTPNEKYYDGVPTVDELEFRWIPEVSTRVAALQTGEIDATWGIPDDQVPALASNSELVVENTPSTSVITMWMNASRPALASSEVRNALWSAVDFETIITSLFPETGAPSDSIVAPNVLGYSAQTPKEYDPEGAKAALEAEGFDFNQTLQIQFSGSEYQQFIEAIASNLAEIGVKVEPTQKEPAVFLEDLLALNWDINFQALGTAAFDSATNTGRLYPCAAGRTGYCNPELDEILAAAGNTSDTDERIELYGQANEIIWDEAVGMYPMLLNITYAWRSNVTGFEPNPLFMPDLSKVSLAK